MPEPVEENVIRKEMMPLQVRAAVVPASIDTEKRTAKLVWTTGERVLRHRYTWDGADPYYEELSLDPKHVRMGRLNSGAPLLNNHSSWDLRSVIGVVESATLNGDRGEAVVRFSKRADVEPIYNDVLDGVIRNVSVGYRVYRYEKLKVEDGEIPVYRAVDWEPFEISPVAIGADSAAGFRAADKQEFNTVEIVVRGEQKEKSMVKENEVVVEDKRAAPAAQTEEQIRAAVLAERERADGIKQAVRAAKLDDSLADKLIKDGTSLDAARAAVLTKLAEKDEQTQTRTQTRVQFGEDEWQKSVRGMSDWLVTKAGVRNLVETHTKDKVEPGEFRGMTLLDMAREVLERSGERTRGMDKMTLVGKALTHRSGGYHAASDFGVLLENTMHKVLLAAYATTPDTWSRFCATGTVSDFRAHNRYRQGTFGRLDKLTENGEFKNKAIPDGAKETITASTRGNIIALSRQSIINDDMGAFTTLATRFGRAAKLSVEMDVYDTLALNSGLGPTLTDGNPIFHARAGANNITTSAAITAAAIDLDRVAMASIKDLSGNEILDLRPAVLLLPISLGSTARTINDSQYDPDTVANKAQMKPNAVRGLFRDIVDTPRLSGNRRYLFADPAVAPVLEVAFLDGQQEPFLDNEDGWRVDGTEWKVRMDYGVAGVGYEGAVTNAGG